MVRNIAQVQNGHVGCAGQPNELRVVQQAQETSVTVTAHQPSPLPHKIHIKAACLCPGWEFRGPGTALHGLREGWSRAPSAPPPQPHCFRWCWTVKGYSEFASNSHKSELPKPASKQCRAVRLLFHFTNALDKKVGLSDWVLFFLCCL